MSAFHGMVKWKLKNVVKANKRYCNALDLLGERLQIEDHLFDIAEGMVCQVYGFLNKPDVNDVWEVSLTC